MPERPIREEVDDLIVRTREAHEVLKDIKAATKELKDTIKTASEVRMSLFAALAEVANDGIETAVDEGLKNWTKAIDEAIVDATEAVYQRFDVIAAILLGEDNDMEEAARLVRTTLKPGHQMTATEEWKMDELQKALDRRLGDQVPLRRSSLRPEQGLKPE